MQPTLRLTLLIALACLLPACARHAPRLDTSGASHATFEREAVAADHPLASQAGAEILAGGGNAVDAAVATSFALSVVRPYSCGIGGGGFMVIHLAARDGRPATQVALNYRETSPAGVTPTHFESLDDLLASRFGGHSVATPGTIVGLLGALDRYGSLDRETVLAPAIRLARAGFRADAHYVSSVTPLIERFRATPGWTSRFAFVWERYLLEGRVRVGDRIHVPEQARAFELLAREGVRAYTHGEIGRAIVESVRADGGLLSRADLRAFHMEQVPPARAQIAGLEFVGMPPPSSGGVTMFEALRLLEEVGYDFSQPLETPQQAHLVAEALKHAFADRAEWFADPAFTDVPVERLLSDAYIASLAARIDPERTGPPSRYGSHAPIVEDGGTSHLSVVDRWGNAVACTETINLIFGSLVAVPEFGFVLNDQMDDFLTRRGQVNAFGLAQSVRNLPEAGKRPLSSMSPTVVLDGDEVRLVAGASGGPRIITGTMQAIMRALAGRDAITSVSAPRLHHQWVPDRLDLEPGALGGAARGALRAMGHELGERGEIGNVQLIRRSGAAWDAACDPRKGGRPSGR
jgi:gamma-glutamyltranspeptidase/glutathione hydrolase